MSLNVETSSINKIQNSDVRNVIEKMSVGGNGAGFDDKNAIAKAVLIWGRHTNTSTWVKAWFSYYFRPSSSFLRKVESKLSGEINGKATKGYEVLKNLANCETAERDYQLASQRFYEEIRNHFTLEKYEREEAEWKEVVRRRIERNGGREF